jgi:hypothetical protein
MKQCPLQRLMLEVSGASVSRVLYVSLITLPLLLNPSKRFGMASSFFFASAGSLCGLLRSGVFRAWDRLCDRPQELYRWWRLYVTCTCRERLPLSSTNPTAAPISPQALTAMTLPAQEERSAGCYQLPIKSFDKLSIRSFCY